MYCSLHVARVCCFTFLHPSHRACCTVGAARSTLVIWVVSVIWFVPIHKGMLKAVRGENALGGDEKQEQAAQELLMGAHQQTGNAKSKDA